MATNASRRARERRIRAKYRKKVVMTGFIMLLIGLAAGYLICMLTTDTPEPQAVVQPTPVVIEATPQVIEATPQVIEATPQIIEATPQIVYVTAEPTAEPLSLPTEVETAAPVVVATAVPTAEPTAVPTPEPTAEPVIATQAPIAEPQTNVLGQPLTVTAATQAPEVNPTDAAQVVVATAEPQPVATQAPAAVNNGPVIVPYGEACTFTTQIKADGTARRVADAEAYENLSLTMEVDAHKGPTYFQSNYSDSYMLQGNEAVVEFEMTLNEYYGNADIVPQNFLLITFRGETDGSMIQGFQLMDTEIGGKTGISIYSDTPTTLYKRYPYSKTDKMVYMVVNTYNDGVENTYWFEIVDPNPEPLYPASFVPLEVGSKGDDVSKLQKKLIDMGLLDDKADGKFGKKTGEAVKACQQQLGLEETGYADATLMNALFDVN